MRENKREPGHGGHVGRNDAPDRHAQGAIGKTTLVEQHGGGSVAASGEMDADEEVQAMAAKKQYTHDDVEAQFNHARNYATFLYREREHAIQALQGKLHTKAPHIDTNILAHLAKVALGAVGNSLQSKVAKGLAKGVAFLVNHYLTDKSKDHVPDDDFGGPVESFIQMHLNGLDKGSLASGIGIDNAQAHTFDLVTAGKIHMNAAFGRAHALAHALHSHGNEAFQLQYNVSLEKWFGAIAQLTFGKDPGGASNIDGHLATQPVAPGNQNYFHGYQGKGGFVHLALKLSYTKALGLEAFTTPGIPDNIWRYQRSSKETPLGKFKLNQLPGGQHLAVIADVKMILKAGSAGVKDHFPGRETGQYLQPMAVSWNERDQVHAQLPTRDEFGAEIQGGDSTWLSEQIGHAVDRKDADAAADHIMRDRVGNHSLEELDGLVKSKGKL